jgi:hypothetical protein
VEQARALEANSPWLGSFIAVLEIPDDSGVTTWLDSGRNGHCMIWGDPARLLGFVIAVVAG